MSNDNCFLFVTMDVPYGEGVTPAPKVVGSLLKQEFWAFSDAAPVKQQLERDDRAIIYVGGKGRHHFVAACTIAGQLAEATDEQREVLSSLGLGFMKQVIPLREIKQLKPPVKIKPLLKELTFVKDKKNYGLSLRLPVRRIPKADFQRIVEKISGSC